MPRKPFFRKFDGWWYVQLSQGRKRFLKKLVRGKENQQEAYRLFNELMAEGTESILPPTKARVGDILRAFLQFSAQNNSQVTFEWYKMFLVSFDDLYGSLKPHQVTQEIVAAWLNSEKGWNDSSRRNAITALKRAFNWAFENKRVSANPVRGIKKPPARSRDRILTPEERKQIYDNYAEDDPFRDFLFAMEETGARPGEISRVEAKNVDLRSGVWVFGDHKTEGKTGEKRVVILTPAMTELTKKLMEQHPAGPLFRNQDGNPWNRNSIRCRFRRIREKLGLGKDLVSYLYRHTACTDMLEAGVGVAQAAEILGHKGVDMVMRHYNHIKERRDHLREQIMKARKTGT